MINITFPLGPVVILLNFDISKVAIHLIKNGLNNALVKSKV